MKFLKILGLSILIILFAPIIIALAELLIVIAVATSPIWIPIAMIIGMIKLIK